MNYSKKNYNNKSDISPSHEELLNKPVLLILFLLKMDLYWSEHILRLYRVRFFVILYFYFDNCQ